MRDKLIELLLEVDSVCEVGECCECVIEACYIHRAADHLIAHGVTFADVPDTNVGRWIPVSERLPEHSGLVLCIADGRTELKFWDYISKKWLGYFYIDTPQNVTHWMPLPEAPKEGEE